MSPLSFILLPQPRQLEWRAGTFSLQPGKMIVLQNQPQALRFTAERLQAALKENFGLSWEIGAGWAIPSTLAGATMQVVPDQIRQPEGYQLEIIPSGIYIKAHDPAGVFYAAATLRQLLNQMEKPELPCMMIRDYPDFPARGVMLDISRDKVYKMETLYELIDRLADWKVNQLQLYTEHTFAYRAHPIVWENASPMTGEEILALDAYCRQRFVELVPNQNSFGHMARWLKFPQYEPLAEIVGEIQVPWGKMQGPFSLAAVHPGSIELIRSMYDELLIHFTSRSFNVGCDETFDLGAGQSKAACEQLGKGRVYLDFLMKIYRDVSRRGFTMQFWGDIILQHPELVPLLPRDLVALSWGYEADHPFDKEGEAFASAGIPFYVCPGTSSWGTICGRTENALGNLRNAAENGMKHGAVGYLNTDWGDNGHWQVPPVSWLGFAAGAAYSWNLGANRSLDIASALSRFAFDDPSGSMGRLAYDLGNAYLASEAIFGNSNIFFHGLQAPWESLVNNPKIMGAKIDQTLAAIDSAMAHLEGEQMARADAALIRREFSNTARLMRLACKRIRMAQTTDPTHRSALAKEFYPELETTIEEYQALWLARSRPGGLEDSLAYFRHARQPIA